MARSIRKRIRHQGACVGATLRHVRALPKLAPRRRDAHKGDFGRVLVLGGSRGMIGAPTLAANAALRSGAGLVTVACPQSIQLAVATLCPCATSIPLPETKDGLLDPRATTKLLRSSDLLGGQAAPSVIAAGPGLGRGDAAFDRAWNELLARLGEARIPVVLDADGLNALHRSADWPGRGWDDTPHFRTVITPHPGEMARLHGTTTAVVQLDRIGFAVETARKLSGTAQKSHSRPAEDPPPPSHGVESVRRTSLSHGRNSSAVAEAVRSDEDQRAIVVLKGADTIVTDGARIYVNQTGNPGMATGGSGDVLTGVIAALIAQGMTCFDAAVLGVHIHGLAGDLAARQVGEISLTAADILDYLSAAFNRH